MHRIKLIATGSLFLLITACKSWDSEDKAMFHQSCMDDATQWAATQSDAETYCNCVLEKVMKKFPDENDALEHIDSVIHDPDIKACKAGIPLKPLLK